MCTTQMRAVQRSDGLVESRPKIVHCPAYINGLPCNSNMLNLPPTPSYTPRSGTPIYRSGDESDRSYHSTSSNSRNKRSSGVYINGEKVMDLNRRSSERHSRPSRSSKHERVVIVESPPTPRTPPQLYTGPHTAPSSPNTAHLPYIVDASPTSHSKRRTSMSHHARPLIVDERAQRSRDSKRVQIEVVDPPRGRHSREHSSSSESSERRRRHQREEERARDEQVMRELKIRERIAKANAEINMRPAAPMPPAPPRRSSTYARPAVTVPFRPEDELVEAVARLNLRESQARREEEEAQRRRLMERMTPKRRSTVGPGQRRPRALYDEGMYRYE